MIDVDIREIVRIAEGAGAIIRERFGKASTVIEKTGAHNIATEADKASEDYILRELARVLPDVNIHAEESGAVDKGSEYTVVIDPLDGTSNFVLGMPMFAVSIGIIDGQGRSVLGAVHHPLLQRTYWAQVGAGAWLNGERIHVNNVDLPQKATVGYGCGYDSPRDYHIKLTERANAANVKRLMANWSPAYELCLLASGRMEAIISNGYDLEDYIAGKLILREAGGKITDFQGAPLTDDRVSVFVASNGTALHDALLEIV